jgi:hypothetical protein
MILRSSFADEFRSSTLQALGLAWCRLEKELMILLTEKVTENTPFARFLNLPPPQGVA